MIRPICSTGVARSSPTSWLSHWWEDIIERGVTEDGQHYTVENMRDGNGEHGDPEFVKLKL